MRMMINYINEKWFVSSDTIPARAILTSTDEVVGHVTSLELADHIVELHNEWFERKQVRDQFNDVVVNFCESLVELAIHLPKKKSEK